MRIDLHTHSNRSDGTETPAVVVETAAAAGLDVIGLTDHDVTSGWAEADRVGQQLGVSVVPGIEVSCSHRGISVHMLGYLFDPTSADLVADLTRSRESRVGRIRKMAELLQADGYPVSYQAVLDHARDEATLGRPHLADALVTAGVVEHRNAAFESLLARDGGYYVSHYAPTPRDMVRLIEAAGGVTVLAHPFAQTRGEVVGDEVIEELAEAGLTGIEVDHRDHSPAARTRAADLAARLGLLPTGSSDYHGDTGKPNRLGENTTSPEVLTALLERASGHPMLGAPLG
ncbi:PHP domain-containing protein [Ornithinicoccus hortensis]|uniref:Polymerase/histidinol phosphatase N-terminal domain-containing protein n=1 Tax=Ornithinicoccus hortensis TaxID=82346 RepID=A0A542YQ28_9MICO|nr:PHP domain-containing protein [Ornithinicoccus hortensis]TQL50157.1 hypothetical protein FB467_1260 [Ornithinicoccus hortensis]